MRNAKTGRLILAVAASLACHLLVLVALRSERPIVIPRTPVIELSLMREPEATPRVALRTPDKKETPHRSQVTAPAAPPTVQATQTEPVSGTAVAEARGNPVTPTAPSSPPAAPPPKLVFDCDDLTPKAGPRQRCPPKHWARGAGKAGGEQVAFARQSDFDAEKAQKNGGPIVIGNMTLRPAPDANSDQMLWGIIKFRF